MDDKNFLIFTIERQSSNFRFKKIPLEYSARTLSLSTANAGQIDRFVVQIKTNKVPVHRATNGKAIVYGEVAEANNTGRKEKGTKV